MAVPSQVRKSSPSPGDKAAGRSTVDSADREDSPQEALDILERAVHSPQGKAALKTIETELGGSSEKASRPASKSSSPGMKAASKYLKN